MVYVYININIHILTYRNTCIYIYIYTVYMLINNLYVKFPYMENKSHMKFVF